MGREARRLPPGSRRTLVGLLFSVLLHALLATLLLSMPVPEPAPSPASRQAPGRSKVSLKVVDPAKQAAALARARKARPEPMPQGQVIDLPRPAREEVPDQSKFLSRWNTKTDRERKARDRGQHKGERAGEGGRAKEPQERVAGPAGPAGGDGKPKGQEPKTAAPEKATPPGPGAGRKALAGMDKLMIPTLDGGGRGLGRNQRALGGGEPLSGGFVSDDALLGVPEEGDTTLVNSRSFKYWDFFQRVKDRVRTEWTPGDVYRGRDPYGKVYGQRDRLTVLSVLLDEKGQVQRVEVSKESGLPFLDQEAVRAFRDAGPFPNPPKGLADERGRIAFNFGFLLEFNSSRARFFWQPPGEQ